MLQPVLTCNTEEFIFRCSFQDRFLPKKAGFYFDPLRKVWCTTSKAIAARLRDYADDKVKNLLRNFTINVSPWSLPLSATEEGLELLDFQKKAIQFALERNRCYLGLDPGLGKTIVAAMIARNLKQNPIYICPPFLVRNVEEEFKKWAPEIAPMIVPDSNLVKWFKVIEEKTKNEKVFLIVDEAHRFKNMDAQRTKFLLGYRGKRGLVDLFDKRVLMSGTPMPNRPFELFPILRKEAHETIDYMNSIDYGEKYCNAFNNGFGWDFSDASNMPELARRVIYPSGPYMLRLKKDLLDLPPKLEEVFVVCDPLPKELKKLDKNFEGVNPEKFIEKKITMLAEEEGRDPLDLQLGTYRRLLGVAKVNPSVDYIQSVLEETEENILVYAYHKEVIKMLAMLLNEYKPFVITGDTPMNERHSMVKEFQLNNKRLFIGNYAAMGVGFTLTKATRVISVEFDWVPGVNEQAGDRTHRIGQQNSVLHQFIVYKDSFDKVVLETLLRKKRNIKHI